jgi:hypothetical protein
MDEESRYVTTVFFDEGVSVKVIIARLKEHSREDKVYPSSVYYSVTQFGLARKELSDIPALGRERDDGITDAITDRLAEAPNL